MIQIVCRHCGSRYKVKPELAGRSVTCTTCGSALTIPAAPVSTIQVHEARAQAANYRDALQVDPPPGSGAAGSASSAPSSRGNPPGPRDADTPLSTSNLAVAALVVGILGILVPLIGIAALVMGIVAINHIDDVARRLKGRGIALAGAICGGVGTLCSVGVVFFAVVIVSAIGSARSAARQMQNSTQLRGAHQALVTYSQSNKTWYPGATIDGKVSQSTEEDGRRAASLLVLMRKDYFGPELLVSPGETDATIDIAAVSQGDNTGSYAVLEYAAGKAGDQLTSLGQAEWRDTYNTGAIVLADRRIGSPGQPRSIWARLPDEWMGSVVFNDNHVQFELTDDGAYAGPYGSAPGTPATLGHLFDCCGGPLGDGRLVAD